MTTHIEPLVADVSATYETTLLTSSEELLTIAEAWDRLAGDAPFRQSAWAFAWWKAYENQHRQLATIVCQDEAGKIVAIAPLVREVSWRRGASLTFLGGGEACGDALSLLIEPGCEEAALDAIADELIASRTAGGWDCLHFDGIETIDPLTTGLIDRLTKGAAQVAMQDDSSRWVIALPKTYDDYVAGLGKRMRRFVRQTQRDLERSGLECTIRQPVSIDEVAAMFDQLVQLHGKRWQNDGQAGAFASSEFTGFLKDVAHRWFASGALRLFVLSLDGEPAAAAIGVRTGTTFSAFLLGRDPKFDDVRAGWLLNLAMIEAAIAEGVEQLDFLRGDEEYKARLGAVAVPQCRGMVVAPGVFNGVRILVAAGRHAARRTRDGWRRRSIDSPVLRAACRFAVAS